MKLIELKNKKIINLDNVTLISLFENKLIFTFLDVSHCHEVIYDDKETASHAFDQFTYNTFADINI